MVLESELRKCLRELSTLIERTATKFSDSASVEKFSRVQIMCDQTIAYVDQANMDQAITSYMQMSRYISDCLPWEDDFLVEWDKLSKRMIRLGLRDF